MKGFLVGFGNRVSGLGLTVAAGGLVLVVAINGANVFARYVFSSPFSWAEEAMLYIIIVSVSWGASAVAWRQLDICIDAFVRFATGRTRRVLEIFASVISAAILLALFLLSCKTAWSMYSFNQLSDALQLPMWIPHIAFAAGLLLVFLMMSARLLAPASRPDDDSLDQGT